MMTILLSHIHNMRRYCDGEKNQSRILMDLQVFRLYESKKLFSECHLYVALFVCMNVQLASGRTFGQI
jgi:hypothetical protein